MMNTYCYACQTHNPGISWNVQDAEPICGRCTNTFVELVPQVPELEQLRLLTVPSYSIDTRIVTG